MVAIWKLSLSNGGAAGIVEAQQPGKLSKLGANTQATPIASIVQALVDNYRTWVEIQLTKCNQAIPLHKRELDRPGSVT